MPNIISCNCEELNFALEHTPTSRNILLFGEHGIGKSQIVTKFYEGKGYKVVPLFLGQMSDPGDILGLPYRKEVTLSDGRKTEVMDFLPPAWWQEEQPFCLFLDEINRGRPEILNVVMDLALNKKIGNRKLPEGSVIVAAGNIGDGYTINDLDKALMDRFVAYIFKPTVDEWLNWASTHIDKRVVEFISQNNDFLDGDEEADEMTVSPSRRSWEGVSEAIAAMKTIGIPEKKYISGYVGTAAAGKFGEFLESRMKVDANDILANGIEEYTEEISKLGTQDLVRVCDLFKFAINNKETVDKKETEHFYEFLNLLKTLEQNEALGYIMTCFKKEAKFKKLLKPGANIYNFVINFIAQTDVD